jgi:hypothetical protein
VSIDEPKNPDYFNHGTGVHYRGLSATVASAQTTGLPALEQLPDALA